MAFSKMADHPAVLDVRLEVGFATKASHSEIRKAPELWGTA